MGSNASSNRLRPREICAHDAWRALLCPAPLPKAVLVNGTWQAPPFAEASGPHSRSWSAGGIFASIIPREIYFYMCVKLVGPYAQATLANAYLTLDGCTKSSPLPSNSMLFQVAEGRRIKKIRRKPSLPTLILGYGGGSAVSENSLLSIAEGGGYPSQTQV